jgi:localization factor PodJL
VRLRRKSYRDDDDDDPRGEELAAVNDRLDALTRQLERIAEASVSGRGSRRDELYDGDRHDDRREARRESRRDEQQHTPNHVTEALARLDRRLDQIITDTRATAEADRRSAAEAERRAMAEIERRAARMAPPAPAYTPPPAPAAPPPGPANWAAEISARQRALEGGPAAAPAYRQPQTPAPTPAPDLSGLEQHLRQITSQIASLHQPYEDALTALRSDLAEVARALTQAVPRQAIEQLENEVRSLTQRLDRSKQNGGADPHALAALEQGIAEVRDALRHMMPAENLAGLEEVVRTLSHKIDHIASASHDPGAFQQIEHAIHQMQGVVQNVASDGALAQLAAEVHGLSQRVEHAAAQAAAQAANTGSDALQKLELRLGALMDSGRSVPPELEEAIRSLSERIDRMQMSQDQRAQLSHSDQLVLGALEDRIVKLAEKLDASDQRLNNIASMERGIADLLVMLEEMRNGSRGPRVGAAPVAEAPAPKPEPAPAVEPLAIAPAVSPPPAPAHHLPPVHHLEAPRAPDHVFSTIPSAPQPAARQSQPQDRKPINPDLPPDTPLEPGAGMPRIKPGSPAARIAASEAALGNAKPASSANGGVAAARAAARTAKSSFVDTPVIPPKTARFKKASGWFTKSPKKKKPVEPLPALDIKPEPLRAPEIPPPPPVAPIAADAATAPKKTIGQHIKTLLIAASVVAIVLGAVQTAINFMSGDAPAPTAPTAIQENLNINTAPSVNPPNTTPSAPSRPMPTPEGTVPAPDDGTTNSIKQQQSSFFDPRTVVQPKPQQQPQQTPAEVTGSIPRHAPRTPTLADGLPPTITGALRTGIAAQDPAAEYELATRYSEGRGVTHSAEEAVRWLDRAARQASCRLNSALPARWRRVTASSATSRVRAASTWPPPRRGTPRPCTTSPCFTPRASTASPITGWPHSGSAELLRAASPTANTISRSSTPAALEPSPISPSPTNGLHWPPPRATRMPPRSVTRWARGSTRRISPRPDLRRRPSRPSPSRMRRQISRSRQAAGTGLRSPARRQNNAPHSAE